MKLRRFCAKCGKELQKFSSNEEKYLCNECLGSQPMEFELPKSLTLRNCVTCGAYSLLIENREFEWKFHLKGETDIDFLTQMLYDSYFSHLEKKEECLVSIFFDPNLSLIQSQDMKVLVRLKFENSQKDKEILIKTREIHCQHCGNKIGGRFDAIIQIRIQHERDEETLENILKNISNIEIEERLLKPKYFITDIQHRTNGYDLKVSTNAFSKLLASRLRKIYNFQLKMTKRLMGKEATTGGDLYRHYTLLKLLPVHVGDLIDVEGEQFNVGKITNNKVLLKNNETGKKELVNFDLFEKKKWKFV